MGIEVSTYFTTQALDSAIERKAALIVCSRARSISEARDLLDVLGITRISRAASTVTVNGEAS